MGADGDTGSGKRTGIIWQAFDKEIKFRLILGDIERPGFDFDQRLAGFFVCFPSWRYLEDGRAGSGCHRPETNTCSTSNQEKPTDEKNS
jgi:hypothetical protein